MQQAIGLVGRLQLGAVFPRASEESLARLADTARPVHARRGTILAEPDAAPAHRTMLLVTDGFVAIDLAMADDRRAIISILPAGNVVGLLGIRGERDPFRVVALTATTAVAWRGSIVDGLAAGDAGIAADLLEILVGRLPYSMRLSGLFALASIRSRLATMLLAYEYLCFHPRRPVIGRSELPALAAASREMTNRILREWEASGMIRRHGLRGLELLDPRRLTEEANRSGFHPFAALNQARPVLHAIPS